MNEPVAKKDAFSGSSFVLGFEEGKGEFTVNSKCAGMSLADFRHDVKTVRVSLVSKNLRDKVLYELSSPQLMEISADLLKMKQFGGESSFYIPFALGNLNLDNDNVLRVEIELVPDSEKTFTKVSRVILANTARQPLSVKVVESDTIDTAYYRRMLMSGPASMQYFQGGEKVYFPITFTEYLLSNNGNFISVPLNTTIELGASQSVCLLDY